MVCAKDIRQIFLLEGVLFSGIGATSGMALAFVLIAQQWLGIVKIPGGTFGRCISNGYGRLTFASFFARY